ncbi:FAS1-like dehydratase domain-containing protein [Pseudooceanicola aestuarii]|uniref:FAS1-like dehydratase domain-containing protein n=1 Tax=Pseudooceanicola aestuarii TaxID=2697319 RepID=UPI0013D1756F|nr:MaoC family dehydratase N-terminal domain-containing protein [Pseudooceanicola aestuarii]
MRDVIDIDHLRQWIGREETARDWLTPGLADRFRAVTDLPAPLPGEAPPQMIHLCLSPPAVPNAELGPDGHPARGGFLPPVALPNRMWAGGEMLFHRDLTLGAEVTRHSVIEDVVLKDGRTGPLCFVTLRHRISDAQGLAVEERQDIVYRGSSAGSPNPPPAPQGAERHHVRGDAVVLFRYSALTFNGHRIHYDRSYVTEVEGYPGLIVHGPLQATWLCHMAARLQGRRPRRFRFRSTAPLFDVTPVHLHADRTDQGWTLWTASDNGPIGMKAEAEF